MIGRGVTNDMSYYDDLLWSEDIQVSISPKFQALLAGT